MMKSNISYHQEVREPLLGRDAELGNAAAYHPHAPQTIVDGTITTQTLTKSMGSENPIWTDPKTKALYIAVFVLFVQAILVSRVVGGLLVGNSNTMGLIMWACSPIASLMLAHIMFYVQHACFTTAKGDSTPKESPPTSAGVVTSMHVVVPPGVFPGQTIFVRSPRGQLYQLVIPQNAGPGSQLQIPINEPAMEAPPTQAPKGKNDSGGAGVPDHIRDEEQMEVALKMWVETSTDAAEAAIFSPLGIWVSPSGALLMSCMGVYYIAMFLIGGLFATWWSRGYFCCIIAFIGPATLIRAGKKEEARKIWLTGFIAVAFCYFMQGATFTDLCNSDGTDDLGEDMSKDSFSTCRDANIFLGVWSGIAALFSAAAARWPAKSFLLFFFAVNISQHIGYVWYAASSNYWRAVSTSGEVPFLVAVGWYMLLGRRKGVLEATSMCKKDAKKYDDAWELLLLRAGLRDSLKRLWSEWRWVQDNAIDVPKRQENASSLCNLFVQADEVRPHINERLVALAARYGGVHKDSTTKKTNRALQKVFRSYGGDWRKLCDLCRASIEFTDINAMAACLRAIGDDAEIQVVKAADEKMRLREDYDSKLSGGYRDIQLCVRVNNAETRARGLDTHLCEVQLHLRDMLDIKSKGGGHRNYIRARNLKGT